MTWILIAAVAAGTVYLQREANEKEASGAPKQRGERPPLIVVEPTGSGGARRVDTPQQPPARSAQTSPSSAASPAAAGDAALSAADRERLEHALAQGDETHVAIELLALARSHPGSP
ncbi:MAG: hypothetical protein D6776_01815, partial [Planctomycetota bacterium]